MLTLWVQALAPLSLLGTGPGLGALPVVTMGAGAPATFGASVAVVARSRPLGGPANCVGLRPSVVAVPLPDRGMSGNAAHASSHLPGV